MAENTYKETPKEKKPNDGQVAKGLGFFRNLLNGSFLSKEKSADLLPFLLFLAFVAVLLIANTYYAEKKVREIERMRAEVTELRTIYISNKAELMYLSNQSEIARRLRDQGFVESTVPPRVLDPRAERRNFFLGLIPAGKRN
ncbi:MAG: FtsL-like putative cell division protein [Bacteroidales bacterium]